MSKYYPYLYFWSLGLLIVFFAIRYGDDTTLDINIHDTYYVMQKSVIDIFFIGLTITSGLLYFIFINFNFPLKGTLTIIHTVSNLAGYLTILILPEFLGYFSYELNLILFLSFIIILASQPLFLINVLRAIYLKLKNNHND
ncbi:MAG: hypothetical protein CL613_00080 [Aquimarina sp.]|nr:hypothetical protein [Aquimarina sp.]